MTNLAALNSSDCNDPIISNGSLINPASIANLSAYKAHPSVYAEVL